MSRPEGFPTLGQKVKLTMKDGSVIRNADYFCGSYWWYGGGYPLEISEDEVVTWELEAV